MEIKSKKMPKTEKMQKMCILLGARSEQEGF